MTPYVVADPADISAGLDGMTRAAADALFVAANAAGEIWRVSGDPPQICVLLRGLPPFPDGPSAVAVGHRDGPFPAENLYVVTFGGDVIELFDVAAAKSPGGGPGSEKPKLRLTVRPRKALVGEPTSFVFRTTTAKGHKARLGGVRVRVAGGTFRISRRGRAHLVASLPQPGKVRARARLRGYRRDSAAVRVRQPD